MGGPEKTAGPQPEKPANEYHACDRTQEQKVGHTSIVSRDRFCPAWQNLSFGTQHRSNRRIHLLHQLLASQETQRTGD